jgi:ABC-type Na+ transport system ATPase subunit NatA
LIIHQGSILFDGALNELRQRAGANWSLERFFLDTITARG